MYKLDYCNSILLVTPQYNIDKMQRIQNIACRVIFRLPKHAQVATYLAEFHWLKIEYCIIYKIAMLVYKCRNGMAPEYLSDLLLIISHDCNLWYKTLQKLPLSRSTLSQVQKSSFTSIASHIVNSLPWNITDSVSLESFKYNLKMYLFQLFYNIN